MGKILIVEDEVNIRMRLVKMVKNINASLVIYDTGAAKAALLMATEDKIDMFILDIQLEDYSGIELALQLREIDIYKLTPIIFVSGDISKELDAYRQIHCYSFIEKPFKEKDIRQVLEDTNYGIINEERCIKLKLKQKNITYVIRENDIIFIEKKNRILLIKTISEDINYSSLSLRLIQEQLSTDFLQCHKGFVINKTFIRKIDKDKKLVYLDSVDYNIPIGRKFINDFYESIESI